MGWGRYSTQDIERLALIALGAIVFSIGMPAAQKARDALAARGIELAWYQQLGLAVFCLLAALIGLVLFGLLLEGLLRLIGWMTRRRRASDDVR